MVSAQRQPIEVAISVEEQSDAFGVVLLGHAQQGPQIDRRAFAKLDQHQPGQVPTHEWSRLEYPGVEPVIWVPAAVALGFAVVTQLGKAVLNHVNHSTDGADGLD